MKNLNDEEFGRFVRDVIRPVGESELSTDLWPRMLGKLAEPTVRVPWFDWVLAALMVLLCLIVPGAIPGLLYNL